MVSGRGKDGRDARRGNSALQEQRENISWSGPHVKIRVMHLLNSFEIGGAETLNTYYQGPGVNKQKIPASVLFHTKSES